MDQLELWQNVRKKQIIITTDNQWDLPDSPGVYGWFLPFHVYKNDLSELVEIISEVYLYDAKCKGNPTDTINANFNWDSLNIKVNKESKTHLKENTKKFWKDISMDEKKFQPFSETLLLSSIFSSPLYVGKAKNLKDRYYQHVKGLNSDKNTFYSRFRKRMDELKLTLTVSDLLFICIPLEKRLNDTTRGDKAEEALEDILMSILKPSYSDR
jgi:predicted GIY-YIG superfamily endonuclease